MKGTAIVLGGGGHAKVVVDILLARGLPVQGYVAPQPSQNGLLNLSYLGTDDAVSDYAFDAVWLVNGIGSVGDVSRRQAIYLHYRKQGYEFPVISHPSAVISQFSQLSDGAQICAGAVIQPDVTIGENVIVNTRAAIDHDCIIAAHVHIAPGVTLSGGVHIGEGSHIGAGATVLQGVHIGRRCIVGAGAVVIRDVPDGMTVVGVPARGIQI